jgi:hypothetical protein
MGAETKIAMKTKLHRALWVRAIRVILGVVAILLLFLAGRLPDLVYWSALVTLLFLGLGFGLFDRLYLTPDSLQKDSAKVLYRDIDEVRSYACWYIVWDRYGDSIWVPVGMLDRTSKQLLRTWLKGGGLK